MTHPFLIAFALAGIFFIIKGIRLRLRLDRHSDDYESQRKKSYGYIWGGILFILIELVRFYTRIALWGWS